MENSEVKEVKKSEASHNLYSIELSKGVRLLLFITVACIYFCTVVSFWSELLIAESSQCDAEMDCFARSMANGTLVQQDPLDDCPAFSDAGYIIECYTITFNYINAIGNSGSVLVVGYLDEHAICSLCWSS